MGCAVASSESFEYPTSQMRHLSSTHFYGFEQSVCLVSRSSLADEDAAKKVLPCTAVVVIVAIVLFAIIIRSNRIYPN